MKRRDFLRGAVLYGSTAVGMRQALAQTERGNLRLVFARGGDLYVSPALDGSDARRVLTLGANTLWAVSPDGRRVIWLLLGASDKPETATLFLSDLIGRHQKKLLTLADLRDRQGQKVTQTGVDNAGTLTNWQPVSVSVSVDGRTVYLGCLYGNAADSTTKRATFAVDAINGTALVDGDGRWKPIAPLSHIDAQGNLLTGLDTLIDGRDTAKSGGPIAIVNTAEGGIRTVLGGAKKSDPQPADVASALAVAPDHRSIVYISAVDKGLWLRDRWAAAPAVPRQLASRATGRPQWSENSKTVFFTAPASDAATSFDLFQLDTAAKNEADTAPRLILKNVDAFALAPL